MKLERERSTKMAELEEIKLKLFEHNLKRRNDSHENSSHPCLTPSSKKQIEEMIAHSPSLTDLRLMLEKKSDNVSKREKRLIKIERELRRDQNILMMQLEPCCSTPKRIHRRSLGITPDS
jgi:hypothetical protein